MSIARLHPCQSRGVAADTNLLKAKPLSLSARKLTYLAVRAGCRDIWIASATQLDHIGTGYHKNTTEI
jgi:hypothetical protein